MATKDEILTARRRLGESQAKFGKRFGVEQNTIHRWETIGIPETGTTRALIERVLTDLASPRDGHPDPNPASGAL